MEQKMLKEVEELFYKEGYKMGDIYYRIIFWY